MDTGRFGPQEEGIVQGACYEEWNFSLVCHLLSVQDICLHVCPRPVYLSQSDSGHLFLSFLHLRELRILKKNCSAIEKRLCEWLIDEMSLGIY